MHPDLSEKAGFAVLEDAASLESFLDDWYVEAEDSVDFRTESAVGLYAQESATCGFRITETAVYDNGSVPHIVFAAEDTSGTCEWTCDAESSAVWVVALPRPTDVTACAQHGDVCD